MTHIPYVPLFMLILCVSAVRTQLVELPNGVIRGRDNVFFYSYESIPYAEPPVGALRFEAPQPYSRTWKGIFNATQPPVECMQQSEVNSSRLLGAEDCLTVNVYVPKSSVHRSYPVVVILHGGGFMYGAVANYRADRFMSTDKAILVAISYRLGPFGFLSAEDNDFPGNNGLKDQRLALEWVQQNIVYFGGEPENVVVVGHSAGGASVHFQLLRNDFNTLAKAAVSISGIALNPFVMQTGARERAFAIGDMLKCEHRGNTLSLKRCLQSKQAEDIYATIVQFRLFHNTPFNPFGVVIEDPKAPDAFVTKHAREAMQSGDHSQVPWLVSYTKDDGGFVVAQLLEISSDTQREIIENLNARWLHLAPHFFNYMQGPSTYATSLAIRRQYMKDLPFSSASYTASAKLFTDRLFKNGIFETMQLHRDNAVSPLYAYIYDNPYQNRPQPIFAKRKDIQFGTVHGDDYLLLFPVKKTDELLPENEIVLRNLSEMLVNFAVSGQLQYGPCQFVDNTNKTLLQFVHITQNDCKNVVVNTRL